MATLAQQATSFTAPRIVNTRSFYYFGHTDYRLPPAYVLFLLFRRVLIWRNVRSLSEAWVVRPRLRLSVTAFLYSKPPTYMGSATLSTVGEPAGQHQHPDDLTLRVYHHNYPVWRQLWHTTKAWRTAICPVWRQIRLLWPKRCGREAEKKKESGLLAIEWAHVSGVCLWMTFFWGLEVVSRVLNSGTSPGCLILDSAQCHPVSHHAVPFVYHCSTEPLHHTIALHCTTPYYCLHHTIACTIPYCTIPHCTIVSLPFCIWYQNYLMRLKWFRKMKKSQAYIVRN